MTFRINGIKQKQSGTTPISLVVINDSSLLVRKILEKYNILVLSINEYTPDPKTFGDIRAKVKRGFDGITMVSDGTDIQTVCENLLDTGLEIIEINSFKKPIPPKEMEKILETARINVESNKTVQQQIVQTKKEEQKKIYEDPRLARAKIVIEWIFARLPAILKGLEGQDKQETRRIESLEDDLRKLRMGNNYEKIRDAGGELLKLMQEKEEYILNLHSEQATQVISGSALTDIDIEREEMKRMYTQQKKALGAKISLLNDEYALFGKVSLFRKFFQKEILNFLGSPSRWLYSLHETALICLGFFLCLSGGFVVYNLLRPTLDNLDSLRYRGIQYGCFGLCLWIGSFWKKKNIVNLILIYGVTFLTYRILIELITTNFALTT